MRKLLRYLACTMVVLTIMGSSALAQDTMLELTPEQEAEIAAALEDETKEMPVEEQYRITTSPNDLSITPGLSDDWLHILLLGTDTGSLKLNYGRTDAMLVLSVNKENGQLKLSSVVRDLFVQVPKLRNKYRINAANAFGGPLLAVKTVNEVLGLNIRHYCSINFVGFEEIVDYLGGVTLELSGAEAVQSGVPQMDGPQLLNGEQALNYVRIRSLDNNFGRNERQREFLAALLEQVKRSSFDQMLGAITAGFSAISTNLTTNEVIALLPAVVRNPEEMSTISLPAADGFRYAQTAAGASVVEYDAQKLRDDFHTFVFGSPTH